MYIKSLEFILYLISLLSYNSLNLSTPLLILVLLLLILRLWVGGIYFVDVCSLGFWVLFWYHQHKNIQGVVG